MDVVRLNGSPQVTAELARLTLQEARDGRLTIPRGAMPALSGELCCILDAAQAVRAGAVVLLALDISGVARCKQAALNLAALLGEVVRVEAADRAYWYSLGVDPMASPIAANGTGPNVPHVDMMTCRAYPSAMAILCERSDPAGGGRTVLCNLERAMARLAPDEIAALRAPVYSYWRDEGLINVGQHLDLFAVLPSGEEQRIRFTSKLPARIAKVPLPPQAPEGAEAAVRAMVAALEAERMELRLDPGDLVLFSQLHQCHGRTALGVGAEKAAPDLQRQLWRLYFNLEPPRDGPEEVPDRSGPG